MSDFDPRYVAARRVLLDALAALGPHADTEAIVLAGAQAIYLHTGEGDLALAPFTTDADLAVNPELLRPEPALERAMRGAGFELARYGGHIEPGVWTTITEVDDQDLTIPVDLIVPEANATGGGRRSARLGAHGRHAARRAVGLEAALIDNTPMTITSLETADPRSTVAKVAGPAALLVAKAHKIRDRTEAGRPQRIDDKDAADVMRLMQTTDPHDVAATLRTLATHPVAGAVSGTAVTYITELFGRRGRRGVQMAVRAMRPALPAARVEAICEAYTTALVRALSGRS